MRRAFPWGLLALGLLAVGCGEDETSTEQDPGIVVELDDHEQNSPPGQDNDDPGQTVAPNTTTPAPPDMGEGPDMAEAPLADMGPSGQKDMAQGSPDMGSPNAGSPDEHLEVLVDQQVMITSGTSSQITFQVPQSARSVVISALGDPGQFYTVGEWTDGQSGELVGVNWWQSSQLGPSLCTSCANRISASEGAFAALAPNNQSVELRPGEHTISLYGYTQSGLNFQPLAQGSVELRVVTKVLDAEPQTGRLDLNLYFTGAGGWTAASAQSDAEFQQMLQGVQQLYDPIDIELGQITYTDVPEVYRVVEDVSLPDSDLQQLFALSAGNDQEAVNVFFVEEILAGGPFGGAGTILGISGGIPGPPAQGTWRSGVAVATSQPAEAMTPISKVFAHEIGHHLGLYHSSEQQLFGPQIHDQLEDTPPNDMSNLMFYSGNGEQLSAWQGRVMRLNPWVTHPE